MSPSQWIRAFHPLRLSLLVNVSRYSAQRERNTKPRSVISRAAVHGMIWDLDCIVLCPHLRGCAAGGVPSERVREAREGGAWVMWGMGLAVK